MTNDEAVQWCAANNVRVSFIPGNPARVQTYAQIPVPSVGVTVWSCKIRENLVDAVTAAQQDIAAVQSGAKSPSDPSLVDVKLPQQNAVDPNLAALLPSTPAQH